ncbi:sce7725 family protein [Dickeya dadantii]|uniref:sce7725 family protein n=1 Tax=Dickeya dadantii TaxID=204038 RepID=UPI0014960C12|nr:sce7725 family protein [Dickeya dadantii]NPE56205.1 sce7725 family protein [Dickeya dadantii]NPE67620.1 sce7725 family protein [Dickeya dadantii]
MYSPYLYARGSELLILREVSNVGVNTQGLLPILEPVNSDTSSLIRCLTAWNSDIVVILNPYQNDFSSHNNIVALNQQLQQIMVTKPNIIIGVLVQPGVNFQALTQYITDNSNKRIALLYDNTTLTDQEISTLANNLYVHYHIVLNNSLPAHQFSILPRLKIIIVNDCFRKLARNADYNGPEHFTSLHHHLGQNYVGIGDYTITGRVLDLGGGQPSAVAAHLIFKEHSNNSVWIRHFVSSNTQRGGADVATMFLDVADQITNFVPNNINQFGNNIGLDHYYLCSQTIHSPGLAKNKEFQIAHHISFMLDVINQRI